VDILQKRDGYESGLHVVEAEPAARPPLADAEALLREVPILTVLGDAEISTLARTARPLALGPTERFIVQGEEGSSLFVIADGEVEVVVRQPDGEDVAVDTMARGAVLGEMALLTGDPRAATARARDGALVYEVGRRHFDKPLVDNPQWIDQLAEIMTQRLRERAAFLAKRGARSEGAGQLAGRIRRRLQSQARSRAVGQRA
jgi:CRP-like cAMP-binding protein